jgi:hypothetical protein
VSISLDIPSTFAWYYIVGSLNSWVITAKLQDAQN